MGDLAYPQAGPALRPRWHEHGGNRRGDCRRSCGTEAVRIVFDTNVLISAMLNPRGTPGAILALILAGEVVVLYDDRILAEYRDVLARPKLRIPPAEAELVLGFFEAEGVLTSAPPLPIDLPDPDDLPFLEVAVASRAD